MAGPIVVSIVGDNRRLSSAVDSSRSQLGKLGGFAKGAGLAVAGGMVVAGAAVAKFGADSVKAASDSQQSLGATRTVFGKYADDVIARSKDSAKAIGVSANQYRELSNVVGASLSGAGVPMQKAADLTDKLNVRAADLAATFGGTTSDAVSAFSSLLRGEADPIERYGISVKQSDVNARLAAAGQDKLTGAALKQAEMQARLDLAFQQSSKSAGAFGRESDTLANRQQILGAMWEDLKAKAGSVLLPALTSLGTYAINTLMPALEATGKPIMNLAGQAAGVLAPAMDTVRGVFAAVLPVATTLGGAWASVAGALLGQLIPAVVQVGGYLVSTFGPVLTSVGQLVTGTLVPGFVAVAGFVTSQLLPIVVKLGTSVAGNLRPVLDQVAKTITGQVVPAIQKAAGKFQEWWPTIQKIIVVAAKLVAGVVEVGTAIIGKVLPPVIKLAGFLAGTLIGAVTGAIGVVIKIGGAVVDAGQKFVDGVQAVGKFATGVQSKVGTAIGYVKDIPGKVKDAMSGAKDWLVQAGKDVIYGLGNGIYETARDWLAAKVNAVGDWIPGWIKKRLGIASPSKVMAELGVWTVKGIGVGLEQGAPGVIAVVQGLADKLEASWKKLDLKGKSGPRIAAAMKGIRDEVELVKGKAKEYQAAAEKLQKARDLASGVAQSAQAFASVAGLGERTSTNEAGETITTGPTAATIQEDLAAKLQALRDFTAKVDQLRQAGLNQTSIDQIISEGVEKGSLTASALVAGGPQAIAAVNGLQAQITSSAQQLGAVAAANMYGTGQQAAAGFIQGLEGDLAAIEKSANKLAKALVRAIRKELKIKSPSRVARGLARNFTDGIVLQATRDAGRVAIAGQATARAMIDGFGAPRAQLTPEAIDYGAKAGAGGTMQLELTAEQIDQLTRGRKLQADLDAWNGTGGRARV